MSRFRPRLTYANLMSTLAVFGVLGGGAYAAAKIGPEDIEKNAVRSKHIKARAVKARHLAPGLLAGKGAQGATGATGSPGPQGEPATRLFAFVEQDGELIHGVGATGAEQTSDGRYDVTFNRTMQECVANVDVYRENLSVGSNLSNHLAISRVSADANALHVDIWNSAAKEMANRSFALTVFCP